MSLSVSTSEFCVTKRGVIGATKNRVPSRRCWDCGDGDMVTIDSAIQTLLDSSLALSEGLKAVRVDRCPPYPRSRA